MNLARFLAVAVLAGASASAGCQSGGPTAALDGLAPRPPEGQETITVEELYLRCPRIAIRDGSAFQNTYAARGETDPAKLVYQASVTDVTRSCRTEGGMMSLTVAAAGKVVPGPLGKPGAVTIPLRVAVTRGEEVFYSQVRPVSVSIADTSGATQFVLNDANIVIPADAATSSIIYVGFDEGPTRPAPRTRTQ